MTIKTFRGLIANQAVDTVTLHTNDGSVGYRVVKFEIMPPEINMTLETVVKIYKVPQTSGNSDIDFSNQTLLAAAMIKVGSSSTEVLTLHTIFDREIFNQDIYITNSDEGGGAKPINYYIELEQIRLDLNENTVATLKDIRNNA